MSEPRKYVKVRRDDIAPGTVLYVIYDGTLDDMNKAIRWGGSVKKGMVTPDYGCVVEPGGTPSREWLKSLGYTQWMGVEW